MSGFWAGAQDDVGGVDWGGLASRVGGWGELERADADALVEAGVSPARAARWLAKPARGSMGDVLTLADDGYPEALRRTRQPPPVLCVEGDAGALRGPGVAVVGTRDATGYGRGVARHLGHALASAGRVVVSGLARGVDAEAHLGALGAGRTVAVLGHGLGHTAPSSHRRLRARIAAEGGAIVSVWPDELPPRPHTFPQRNLWIAGLSDAVVVVEAGLRSGALITARWAAAEGREVFAVPGPIGAEASVGCLGLLEEGASVVVDVPSCVARISGQAPPVGEALLALAASGASVDVIAQRMGRSVVDVLVALGRLELQGELVRVDSHRWAPLSPAPPSRAR
jgi:DNA protecting protein DprA